MNMTTLINLFRDAIKDNVTIGNWCTANYAKKQTLYKGVDQRNPPAETLYPIVHLYPVSKRVGYDLDQQMHVVGITCGIYDDGHTTTVYANGTLWEYDGIDDLEAFRKLVETAVAAVIPAGSWIDGLNIEYETIEFFPFLLASMEFSVMTPYHAGEDVFA